MRFIAVGELVAALNVSQRRVQQHVAEGMPRGKRGCTLTNLYNARPAWLEDFHRALDKAVFAAYSWADTLTDAEFLERLLALNHEPAAATKC